VNVHREIRPTCIAGTGSYLPERVLTNAELEKMVETSNDWIITRTGIAQRRIAREDETASSMAAAAGLKALESAGVAPDQVGAIVVGTVTPDMPFPNTACFVQKAIGATRAFCFDVEAACCGFLYGMEIGRRFVADGTCDTVLVIGAEKLSCVTDWTDRATCVLFGDGAGAAVLRPATEGRGIIGSVMGSDGGLTDLLKLPAGGSRHPASAQTVKDRMHYMKMSGNEVFKHAVRCMCDAGLRVLDQCGASISDVACIIPHQANVRILQAIASRLGQPMERFYVNLDRVGNISSGSVPVALDEAVRRGVVKKGDLLLFIAFGGGFTWGATLLEF
jgi:3-oxoacyl-[acyl-carrier-protein] synthase-3